MSTVSGNCTSASTGGVKPFASAAWSRALPFRLGLSNSQLPASSTSCGLVEATSTCSSTVSGYRAMGANSSSMASGDQVVSSASSVLLRSSAACAICSALGGGGGIGAAAGAGVGAAAAGAAGASSFLQAPSVSRAMLMEATSACCAFFMITSAWSVNGAKIPSCIPDNRRDRGLSLYFRGQRLSLTRAPPIFSCSGGGPICSFLIVRDPTIKHQPPA